MAMAFQQVEFAVSAPSSVCAPDTIGSNTPTEARVGGSAGGSSDTWALTSEATRAICGFKCIVPAGADWAAGTWTVRFRVFTANMNLTVTAVRLCRINSSGVNQETIGSATGLSVSLGTTGVKTQNVTGVAVTPSVGDVVWVVFTVVNGAMSSQNAGIGQTEIIDSPFDEAPPFTRPTIVVTTRAVHRAANW